MEFIVNSSTQLSALIHGRTKINQKQWSISDKSICPYTKLVSNKCQISSQLLIYHTSFFFFEINNLLHRAQWQSMPTRDYLQCINPDLTYAITQHEWLLGNWTHNLKSVWGRHNLYVGWGFISTTPSLPLLSYFLPAPKSYHVINW